MKSKNPIVSLILATVTTITVSLTHASAQLAWDPAGNQSDSGGAGTWDTTSLNWNDDGSAPNITWASGSAATFAGTGGTIAIASGAGISAGDLTFSNTSGNYLFDATTAGEGIALSNGATIDNTAASTQLRFALDTILSTASGNTITIRPGSGGIQFAQGNNGARNNLFSVAGANLNVDSDGVVRGTLNDVGQFASVSLAEGSSFFYQRNSGGTVSFTNDWVLSSGDITFDRTQTNNNGAYQLSGVVSGAGRMIVNVGGGGTGNLLVLANANTYEGGTEITDDSRLRLTGSGSTGTGPVGLGSSGILQLQGTSTTVAGDISGDGQVQAIGGVATLAGSNTYIGETLIENSRITLATAAALSAGSNLRFNGGNAFLNLATDFTRPLGIAAGQVQWTSGGGFGSVGAPRTVNIGGAAAALTFGAPNFIADNGDFALQLGSTQSTHTTTLVNPLVLPTAAVSYNLRAENGTAGIDGIFSGTISGPGSFQKLGTGVLQLTNASNSWTGSTLVDEGTLLINALSAMPDLSLVSVAAGAAFGGSTASLGVSGFNSILTNATFANGAAIGFDTSGGNFTYPTDLTGSLGVIKTGPNTLTLGGALSYTGPTTIMEGNIIFSGGALPDGSALTLNDNLFNLAGNDLSVGGLASFLNTAVVIDSIGGSTLSIDSAAGSSYNFLGTLGQSGGGSNSFSLVKSGDGIQTLASANHYTGTTTLTGGRLIAPAPASLGATPAVLDFSGITLTGGELRIDVFDVNPWTEADLYSLLDDATISGGSNTRIGLNFAGSWTPSAPISGDLGLTINGGNAGTITWNPGHTYTGETILETGILVLTGDDVIPATSVVEIVNNDTQGVINLNGFNQTIGGLRDIGPGGANTKSLDNNNATIPQDSIVTIDVAAGKYYMFSRNLRQQNGFISFVKEGPGTQIFQRLTGTFEAVNTSFTVNAGVLGLDSGFSTGEGLMTVNSGGTFALEGACGMFVSLGGTLEPGIDGDANNNGVPDSLDSATTGQSTVGTATITNEVEFQNGSSFEVESLDWNGADNITAVAGTDHDLLIADTLNFSGVGTGGLTIRIGSLVPADFTESDRTLVIMQGVIDIVGFATDKLVIDDSAFVGTGTWAVARNGNNIELQYTAGGGDTYETWASAKGLAGPDAAFDADPDGDGIKNGMEFILGGEPNPANPGANSNALLPTVSETSGDLIFTFRRKDLSEGVATLSFQWSTDLSFPPVNNVPVGADDSTTDGITVNVAENSPDADTDTITITVPAAKADQGRVFGRLVATRP
jgi:autotransporter-associated beta strand protein